MEKVYRRGPFILTVLVILFFLLMFVFSFQYSPERRAFPQLAAVVGGTLSIITLMGGFFPKLAKATEVKLGRAASLEEETEGIPEAELKLETWRAVLTAIGWLSFAAVGVYFVGFFATIPVFLFSFFRVQAKLGWMRTLVMTVVGGGILYSMLLFMARGTTWSGAIPEVIPGIIGGALVPPW